MSDAFRDQILKLAAPVLGGLLLAVLASNWLDSQKRVEMAMKDIVELKQRVTALEVGAGTR